MASRLGKMPTASVRRRISLFSRSEGLLDQIWDQTSFGKAVNARMSARADRKSTRLNSSHVKISYAVFCWKKKRQLVCTGLDGLGTLVHEIYKTCLIIWDLR